MHALSSAAVALAVTRACTRGELERCGCDRKVRGVSPEGEHCVCPVNVQLEHTCSLLKINAVYHPQSWQYGD